MPYTPSVTSRTSLNTVSVSGATFNFPLFVASHQYFPERVRSYGNWTEVTGDPAIPTTSPAYAGLNVAFSQRPAPSRVYLGRREVDLLTLTPFPVVGNKEYKLNITVVETLSGDEVVSPVSVVSVAVPTAETIATALQVVIDLVANITAVDATGAVTVVADAGYTFYFSDSANLLDTYTSTETPAEIVAAIQEEDDDWYFISADDHTESFILDMASVIEPTGSSDQPKMYFAATADLNTLVPLPDPAVDIIGKLKEFGYLRTVCDWNDQADTLYPEMGDVSYNGPFQPGSTTWKFMRVAGVPAAANPATGKRLTTSLQGFIGDRNGNWMGTELGTTFYKEGKTVGGEWIDVVRFSDWLNSTIKVELLNLLLNQKGGKIPNTPAGRQLVAATVDGVLDIAHGFGGLYGYLPTTVPAEGDISFFNKVNRILDNVKFVGYLAGAIHTIVVDGNLTYADEAL